MMTELDVINDCLATLGESPLVEIDEDHPFVAGIRRAFANQSEAVQAETWWFNKELITLIPDASSKFIYVPQDTIRCDPVIDTYGTYNSLPIVQRGRRLYDTDKNSYEFDKNIDCILIRNIPFTDLPPSAQRFISLATALKFQQNYDADPQRTNQLMMEYNKSRADLNAENIRNLKPNFLHKTSNQIKMSRIGGYTYRGA